MYVGTKPFQIVRGGDSAISGATPEAVQGYRDYMRERDFSRLTFNDGEKPVVFWARPLTLSERRLVRNKISLSDQHEAAFIHGLVKVENLEHPDGTTKEWVRPTDRAGKEKPIPDDALETHFDEAIVQEIGMVVMRRSFLARSKGHWYPLPDICQAALSAALLHRAGLKESSLGNKPSPKEPLEEIQKSGSGGDESTAATATE